MKKYSGKICMRKKYVGTIKIQALAKDNIGECKMKILKSRLRVKRVILIIAFLVGIIITYKTSDNKVDIEKMQKEIAEKIVRFHVIANSDSDNDYQLKIKVKKAVVDYISPLLENSTDINETREILNNQREEIKKLAAEVIHNDGYDYEVSAKLTYSYFPTKAYGDIILPPGEYEAFEIEIGAARGTNWWCILYPPLCFTENIHGVVPDKSKKLLENVLDEDEYKVITNTYEDTTYRFKILEFFGFY
jgi:stage II sporulation protein R